MQPLFSQVAPLMLTLGNYCAKYDVTTTLNEKPKNTDTLNAALVKAGAYTKLDQKNVTAWLGLRNKAVHGDYSAYTMGPGGTFHRRNTKLHYPKSCMMLSAQTPALVPPELRPVGDLRVHSHHPC